MTACALPGMASGSVVVQIREDFAFSEAVLGLAFAAFWGVAAVASTPAAKLVERIGPTPSMRLAGVIAGSTSAVIALFVNSSVPLIAVLAVGGLSMACATPGANALLVQAAPAERQGLAFGLAQSSVPAAAVLSGLSLPLIAEPFGWRMVFGFAALLSLVMVLLVPKAPRISPKARAAAARGRSPALGSLAAVMVGVTLANAALGAFNTFLVSAAPNADVSGRAAAITLAIGSALTIVFRIALGERADRERRDPLPTVAALLGVGVVGFALVTTGARPLFLAGAMLVLLFAWGWMGLFTYAVVNRYPATPETATGVMQTGFFLGGVLGPIGFGVLAEVGSFQIAWSVATAATMIAAVTVVVAQRVLPGHLPPPKKGGGKVGGGAAGPPGPIEVVEPST